MARYDITYGPNHVGNYCAAPIMADTNTSDIMYQSSYYYLGHFAKYIRPGAVRLLCATDKDELEAVAVVNPDGSRVAVVQNRTDGDIPFTMKYNEQKARITSPAHSIMTLCW